MTAMIPPDACERHVYGPLDQLTFSQTCITCGHRLSHVDDYLTAFARAKAAPNSGSLLVIVPARSQRRIATPFPEEYPALIGHLVQIFRDADGVAAFISVKLEVVDILVAAEGWLLRQFTPPRPVKTKRKPLPSVLMRR